MLTPPGMGARRAVRRGARRAPVGTLLLVAVLTVALVGTAWWVSHRDSGPDVATRRQPVCPTPSPAPAVVAARSVTVNVYNASEKRGLAAEVAAQLRTRGFHVQKVDNDPLHRTVTGAAEVRHNAAGAGAARTVTAQVAPAGQVGAAAEVVSVPDQRRGASVDLVLGAAWHGLRTPADAAAALRPTPQPVPSGCRSQTAASR